MNEFDDSTRKKIGRPKKVGRPKKPLGAKRRYKHCVYLNDDEEMHLEIACQESGLSPTQVLRSGIDDVMLKYMHKNSRENRR